MDGTERFISLDELISVDAIAELLDPSDSGSAFSIYPGEVRYTEAEICHQDQKWIRGIYVLPTTAGEFTITCEILCNEYPDQVIQEIKVVVN